MKLQEVKNNLFFLPCPYERVVRNLDHIAEVNDGLKVNPQYDILKFYLAAQVLGAVEDKYGVNKELPNEISELVKDHMYALNTVFYRMFSYLILICVGESRHGYTGDKQQTITKMFGVGVAALTNTITSLDRGNSRLAFLKGHHDLLTVAEYCEWAFIECFSGGSYGGKPWKNIASKVAGVLRGDISPYTMVDNSWALVHNTGSIFNKNTIYHNCGSDALQILLDIQRGGGIASHIINNTYSGLVTPANNSLGLITKANDADKLLGGVLSKEVPIEDIIKAGAIHKQVIEYGKKKGANKAQENSQAATGYTKGLLQGGYMYTPTVTMDLGVFEFKMAKRIKLGGVSVGSSLGQDIPTQLSNNHSEEFPF